MRGAPPAMTTAAPESGGRVQRIVKRLLTVDGSPARIGAACALGVFFSFSPFFGFQTLLAMAGAFAFRLNKLVVFLGLNANLPWIMGPWYAATTAAAAFALGVSLPPEWSEMRLAFEQRALPQLHVWTGTLRALLWPFVIGASVGAAAVAGLAYAAVVTILRARLAAGPAQVRHES